jgi:hypothetical protein
MQDWVIGAEHRLFHQLWHATRDQWHKLPVEKHNALRGLGWQPGPRDRDRDAVARASTAMVQASTSCSCIGTC